ncbi:hypothetical protein AAVH_19042 [Aphelenchoides avenae]|nr:hypothetical protein AAVH_19042 [Aphelenchus avenae]
MEAEAVAPAERPSTMEAPADAKATDEEEDMVTVQPTVETLAEQLKVAQARNETLAEEKAALHREKTAAASEKKELQKALDEAKAEAAAERSKRIGLDEEIFKKDRAISQLTIRLLEPNQL